VCTVKGGIKNGAWWRKELNSAQPECKKIDPENSGTCHQWTVALGDNAKKVVQNIKQTLNDYIKTTEKTDLKNRVLVWNTPMDELYLSAPKNSEGSDRVFITPHIDGFVGWVPFMRQFRCVYGLTGPHDTVTIQPMRNPDQREVTLGPGVFTCFDFNREIHWIEHRPGNGTEHNEERMVLKLHFYEYPALLAKLGHAFGNLNAQYNFFARRAFLVSQFPDRSLFARAVARAINGITYFGGSTEVVYGYCNAGLVLCIAAATKFNLHSFAFWAGSLYVVTCLLATLFRSNTLGMLQRDAPALFFTSALATGAAYLAAQRKFFDLVSAAVAAAGFALAVAGYRALGPDLALYGAELVGPAFAGQSVRAFPYSFVAHPMALGALVALLGLRLHPTFGPKFHAAFVAQSALHVALLAAEVFDAHVPADLDYYAALADFSKYHASPGNVYAHLATTGLALMGALGLAFLPLRPASGAKRAAGADKPALHGPLLAAGLTWSVVRYAVPDDDAAFATVAVAAALAGAAWTAQPSAKACAVLIVLGTLGQEAAHHYYGEVTYMASYAGFSFKALSTLCLHNLWLVPFELRAAVSALTASLVPAMAPGAL
jgi:hypothetical protein